MQTNIFGTPLEICSSKPLTGFFRDGMCRVSQQDFGNHSVCAIMTDEFLEFSKMMGNDLITPRKESGFGGLKAGEKWCLCASRFKEAIEANKAPKIIPEATSNAVLNIIDIETLRPYFI